MTELPAGIGRLRDLEFLSLYKNQVTSVPTELLELTKLKEFRIGANQLTELPARITQLRDLEKLWLNNNRLSRLPAELFELTKLKELRIGANQLTELPAGIGRLRDLEFLSLYKNQLTSIPAELFELTMLKELNIGVNQLTELPAGIARLRDLEKLGLHNNQLTNVPAELFELKKLKELNIGVNQLTKLPAGIGRLRDLERLWLHNNQLTSVPAELFELKKLKELNIGANQLTTLPAEIGRLRDLEMLWLYKNQLTVAPEEISELAKLKALYLAENRLTTLSRELIALVNLEELTLSDNPDLKIPPELLAEGTKPILEFIGQELQPQWAAKLMFLGEGRAGKSSLLRALRGEEFIQGLESTHGMIIGSIRLRHPRLTEIDMELMTWDFGGQQIYHGLHQFFLTERALYVLVWNGQMNWEECKVREWLEKLAVKAPDARVLLVATYCPKDGRSADLPFSQLAETYPNLINPAIQVDNKTGDGIAELRTRLTELAAELPLMGELHPPSWKFVRTDILERRRLQHTCSSPVLEDIMSARGILAPNRQQQLARFLHQLGEIVYFPDNEALKDTVVLNPEWVSQTISKVLDSPEVEQRLGYFRRDTMERIWRDLDRGLREHMLDLMDEFDMSYRTLESREISIVVERLGQEPPENWDREWNALAASCAEITMKFELTTSSLLPGIPAWFIARQHQYTRDIHWRRGALFADDRQNPRNWALMEAYPEEHYLRLTVRGPSPYDFFSRMRRGLWETFKRYKGLGEGKFKVIETVPCPGKLDEKSCTYEHEVTDLERKLERGRNQMTCNRCDEELSVPERLLGIRFGPTYAKLEEIHADVRVTREMMEQAHSLITSLQGDHAALFNAFQRYEEMQSPYVFILRPGSYESDVQGLFKGTGLRTGTYSELRNRLWKEKMEIQLYCQQPGHWHPLGYERGKNDPATGLYQVELNAEFLRRLAPYMPKLVMLLKYAKPLVKAAKVIAGIPAIETDVDALKKIINNDYGQMVDLAENLPSLDELTKFAEKIPSLEEPAEAHAARGMSDVTSPSEAGGALLRQLRRMLLEKDKDHLWGGLERRYLKAEGHHLWLCKDHFAESKS